jgi:hypothetical protein
MYAIVNFLRSSPSQVWPDSAVHSLLADSSRRLSSGTLVLAALCLVVLWWCSALDVTRFGGSVPRLFVIIGLRLGKASVL